MIKGIGIDIIEISRIANAITKENFKQKIYTPREISYCESRGKQSPSSYAGFFAAKEAMAKALGTGIKGGKWQDIEILKHESGQPYINLKGYWLEYCQDRNISSINLTISHSRYNAIANVILEG